MLGGGRKAQVRLEIRALQQRLHLTTLIVTHDQEEALTMADRLVVMDNGRVHQIGTPTEVYENPANLFVAGFLGRCTVLRGTVEAPGLLRLGARLAPCAPARSNNQTRPMQAPPETPIARQPAH